jgi:peptidoglycan/LPS O-acetylase OafA/YrhL
VAVFRPDIEGLRALAVVPVVVFHANPAWCPGGFAGVDMFFVISGYLITGMILGQGDAFNFKDFYQRRFLRLFPALVATCIATMIAAWFVLAPPDYNALAQSALAALLAGSNFWFHATIDYFGASGYLHPLLHTWSLGVEEQFYLLWPALLVLVRKRKWSVPSTIAAATVVSIVSIGLVQSTHPEAAFYLMPFRVFEFAIGAAVVGVERHWGRLGQNANTLAGVAAACLLAWSFWRVSGHVAWPGPWTLVPVVGTALALASGGFGGPFARVLGWLPFRAIGRISYSVYLVHWPIVTLYRYWAITPPSKLALVALIFVTLAVGAMFHVVFEAPWRRSLATEHPRDALGKLNFLTLSPRVTRIGLAGGIAALVLGASAIVVAGGFPQRLDRARIQNMDKGLTFAGDLCNMRRAECQFGDGTSSEVVYLIGDSHALNLIYGLDKLFRAHRIKGIALFDQGCLFVYETTYYMRGRVDKKCKNNVARAYELLSVDMAPLIIAGDHSNYRTVIGPATGSGPLQQTEAEYEAWLESGYRASFEKLSARKRNLVLVKQSYVTNFDVAKCLSAPKSATVDATAVEPCVPEGADAARARFQWNDLMFDRVARDFAGVVTVDPKAVFCPHRKCEYKGADGLYLRDVAHLTNAGSDFLVRGIASALLAHVRAAR